jgi:hypothetical protein
MKEIWKPVKDYEDLYAVSSFGRVANLNTGKILKPHFNHNGYSVVQLYKDKKAKTKRIHRLVAEAFIPNPKNFPEVDHIKPDKQNNTVSNLRWASGSLNTRNREYSVKAKSQYNGVIPIKNGTKYQTNIFINGKTKHIGIFTDEKEAAKAFNEFCIQNNLKRELNIIAEV